VITVPGSGDGSEFLVTQAEDGLARRISARQIARTAPTPWRSTLPPAAAGEDFAAGQPHAVFLDLPLGIGAGEAQDQFRAAIWQKPWRSQALFVSPQDSGFVQRGLVGKSADLGRLAEPLAPGFEGRLDRSGSVLVELFDASVSSVGTVRLLNGANLAAVRSAAGSWEVLQFEEAEEVSPQV
jgi:hypothetical protein